MARTPNSKPPSETPIHIEFGEKRPPGSSTPKEDTVMSEPEHVNQETNALSASLLSNDTVNTSLNSINPFTNEPLKDMDHESSAAISAEQGLINLIKHLRTVLFKILADVNASEDDINRAHNNVTVAESRLERVRTLLASDISKDDVSISTHGCINSVSNPINLSDQNKVHMKRTYDWYSLKKRKITTTELPLFKLTHFKKESEPSSDKKMKFYNTVDHFFDDFELVFRINEVNVMVHWKDYLNLCVCEDHIDWFKETVFANNAITYDHAKELIRNQFENTSLFLTRSKNFLACKQDINESISDFASRFSRLAMIARYSDGPMLALIFIDALHDCHHNSITTILSSHFGAKFMSQVKSYRDIEKLICHLKGPAVPPTEKKRFSKPPIDNMQKKTKTTDKSSEPRNCRYCNDKWFPGHRCMEFLKERNKVQMARLNEKQTHKHVASDAWQNYAKDLNKDLDKNMEIGKCYMVRKQETNNLITNSNFSLYTPIIIQTTKAMALIDTGATISVINKSFAKINRIHICHKTGFINLAGKNNKISRIGVTAPIEIRYNGKTISHSFEIMEFDHDDKMNCILGSDILSSLGIGLTGVAVSWDDEQVFDDSIDDTIKPNNSPAGTKEEYTTFMSKIKSLIDANISIPKDTFCTVPESIVKLNTTEGKVANVRQYPIPFKLMPVLQEAIDKWLKDGTITKAPVNTAWNSPLTLADKKDANGNKTGKRPCLDTRHLNALLPDDRFPLPLISEIFHKLAGSTIFTTLDLTSAFHRFKIHEKDQPKTAFTFNNQQYMFVGAPFGLKFLSSAFQRVMMKIFENMPFVQCFVDDIVIFSKTMDDHLKHVKAAINALTAVNLILNADKCHFAQNCVYLLGFCISTKGASLDTRKLTNLEAWPVPTNGTDMQRFLGVVNYFREHIPKASMLTAPLDHLRNSKVITKDDWTPLHQAHFEAVKKVLLSNIILSQPDEQRPFYVATDASNYGIAAVLFQKYEVNQNEGSNNHASSVTTESTKVIIKYIGFMARALSVSERNYSTTKRELLAIVFALKKFHKFLWGNPFTLYTDHKALTYLFTQKYANTMMMNWMDTLLDYNFKVVHLKGIDNVLPDHLSRLFPPDQRLEGDMMCSDTNKAQKSAEVSTKVRKLSTTNNKLKIVKVREHQSGDYITPPVEERKALLLKAHLFGHFGAENIVKSLHNDGLHWKNMIEEAVKLVKSCPQCQKYNITRKGYHPLRPVYSHLPGDHWAMDLAELPTSLSGNKYMLVMLDICTRFCILRCIPNKEATTIVKHLVQIFSDFGYPRIIQSDNGTEFKNNIMRLLTESTGLDHRITTPYHPQGNGSAERWVQTAKATLAKAVQGCGQDWDTYVPGIQLAINNKVSKRLNTPPFNLMFARRMNAFEDYRDKDPKKYKPISYEELIKRLDHMNNVVFPAIADKTDNHVNNMKKQFEKHNTIINDFKEGSTVMVKISSMTESLNPIYEGPYTIIRKTKGGSYILRDEMGVLMSRDYTPSELKQVNNESIDELDDSEEVYEIEAIVDHRGNGNKREYRVRWKGYSKDDDSWLTTDKFTHPSTIQNYLKRIGQAPVHKNDKRKRNEPPALSHNPINKAVENMSGFLNDDINQKVLKKKKITQHIHADRIRRSQRNRQ